MQARTLKFSLVLASACIALLPMGCKKAPPITLACNATPPAVYAGQSVTATATAGAIDPNKKTNVIYAWSGTGATGSGTSATVDTTSLAPGTFNVQASVKEGKKGKEGLKPGQSAQCSTSFTVKEFDPPTVACSASPTTIKPGDTSTITATGMSPQNRPLTYSYSAVAGSISGNNTTAVFSSTGGNNTTAVFSSTGAPTGSVGITCKVADDKGHSASADTSVSIEAPPPPPVPHVQALCSISFEADKRRPTRVDNESKACLDEVALDLQRQSDAKGVIVGEATAKEKTAPKHHRKNTKVEDLAAQRAVNSKDYLVTEKGIDPSRISVATGTTDGQKVENYLVPAGANVAADIQGTTPVDESAVKAQARKALAGGHHKHHADASK